MGEFTLSIPIYLTDPSTNSQGFQLLVRFEADDQAGALDKIRTMLSNAGTVDITGIELQQ